MVRCVEIVGNGGAVTTENAKRGLARASALVVVRKDPHTFLSRMTIIGEGVTEVGFCKVLLERALEGPLQQYGVHVSDGKARKRGSASARLPTA